MNIQQNDTTPTLHTFEAELNAAKQDPSALSRLDATWAAASSHRAEQDQPQLADQSALLSIHSPAIWEEWRIALAELPEDVAHAITAKASPAEIELALRKVTQQWSGRPDPSTKALYDELVQQLLGRPFAIPADESQGARFIKPIQPKS